MVCPDRTICASHARSRRRCDPAGRCLRRSRSSTARRTSGWTMQYCGGVGTVSVRDAAVLAARGGAGATTVASTAHLAAAVGISVFATGGLGGVRRDARDSWDESADLMTLSRPGVLLVCAGVKSILDVGATLERLESLHVAGIG